MRRVKPSSGWKASNLPPLGRSPGHQWGQHIFFPVLLISLFPDRWNEKQDWQIHRSIFLKQKRNFRYTLCSISSRLLLSFKKLSFSRWACWVIWVACFLRVASRSCKHFKNIFNIQWNRKNGKVILLRCHSFLNVVFLQTTGNWPCD